MNPSRAFTALLALALLAGFLSAAGAGAATGPWRENEQSAVRLVSPWRTAPAGGELWLGLHFTTIPGWHVYWKNAGDAGYPPAVSFEDTPEIRDAELLWPAPHRFELPGDLVAFGYEEEVIYPLRARLQGAAGERLVITAEVDYLVCEETCIPYRYPLTLEQPLAAAGAAPVEDAGAAALLAAWRARVPPAVEEVAGVTTAGRLDFADPADPADPVDPALEVMVAAPGLRATPEAEIFFEPHDLFELGRPRAREAEGTGGEGRVVFRVPLALLEAREEFPRQADFAWTVTGLRLGDDPLAFEAARRVTAAAAEASRPDLPPPSLPIARLAAALAGGLLLAFTPALLALLGAGIPALAELPRERRATAAGGTAGGVLAAFAALAALALAARGAGLEARWGALQGEPVVVTLALLAGLLLALRLWGLVEIPPLSGWGAGILAALLALPWSPPGLAGAIDGALASGPGAGAAALLAAGLGLALPFALLAPALAGLAERLTAAHGTRGAREALGFLAAAALVWLLYVLSSQVNAAGLAYVELALLGAALAAWLLQRSEKRAILGAALILALAATAAGALWIAGESRVAPSPLTSQKNIR